MKINAKDEINKIGIFTKDEQAKDIIRERFNLINNRLYRYCKLNQINTHELDNLLNKQLFLSHPERFNDPFDCNFGIHIVGIIESMMNHYMKKMKIIDLDENSSLTDNIALVDSYPFYNEVYRVLNEISLTYADRTKLTEKDLYRMVFSDKKVVQSLLQKVVHVAVNRYQRRHTEIPEKLIEMVIDLIQNKNIDELLVFDDDILRFRDDKSMYQLSQYIHDYSHKMSKKAQNLQFYQRKLDRSINLTVKKRFIDKIGVACFSESPYEPLMWSHYASSYQGFLVEYDLSKIPYDDLIHFGLFLPVSYVKQRPLINKKFIDAFDFSNNMINKSQLAQLMISYFQKSDIWQYEKEWRMVAKIETDESNEELRIMDFPYVSKIILGVNMDENYKKIIVDFADKNDIQIEEVILDNSDYSFRYEPIDRNL